MIREQIAKLEEPFGRIDPECFAQGTQDDALVFRFHDHRPDNLFLQPSVLSGSEQEATIGAKGIATNGAFGRYEPGLSEPFH